MSFTQFTLEDVNTMTVGTTNNLAVGEVNSAFCTGQTALTATTNNSVTLGTYLAAVLGNNVTWTYGTTLGMQDGATVDFSDSTSTQAQGTVALKGGIHPLGMSALAILKAAMTATKALIGVTVAINLVYGTALGVLDATDVSKDKVKQQAAEAASIGASNALLTALLVVVVKRLSTLCEALRQTSTLTLGQTGVSLGTDFLPASQSTLEMSLAETTLTRITPAGQSSISLTNATAGFKRVGIDTGSLNFSDGASSLDFTGPAGASSLLMGPDQATLRGGDSSVLVTPATLTAQVGASALNMTPEDFLVESSGCTLNMAQEVFVASAPGAMMLISPEAIEADSAFIKLG
ncbi:hypothetical protein [Caballeronia sp. HLA56]